jgi:L,D-peptidoglycan transpeptidase YkuD (ErfK/YbiS/YcfS/YnhG family)
LSARLDLIRVSGAGLLSWTGGTMRAALGRGGLSAAKREGDGATPIGLFNLRSLWWRADRIAAPDTDLPRFAITPDCGWSDDPADPDYNRAVRLPHPWRHERLWREDGLYDLMAPLGYNDDPPVPGLGSAIFLHVARPDYHPTEGCVALSLADLLALLPRCGPQTKIAIG